MLNRFFEAIRQGATLSAADHASKLHKGGGGSTTTSNEPPKYIRPYLTDIASQAQQNYANPLEYYPGQTVTPYSKDTLNSINHLREFSSDPNSAGNMAVSQLQNTMRGDYLPSGEMFSAITDPARQAANSTYASGGRYGSAGHDQAITKATMEAAMPYWNSERNNMMNASQLAPSIQMASLMPLLQVGQMKESKNQEYIQDLMNRWNFYQNEPTDRLRNYAGIITPGAGVGGTSTMTQPGGSKLAGAAGGLLGAGMGLEAMGMASIANPWFAPIMLGGGLMGAFG